MRIALAAATLSVALTTAVATPAAAQADEVAYQAAGRKLTGYFAPAAEDPKGLVLIVHDWNGLDDHERHHADMLADLGYDAFALDMFGAAVPVGTIDERRAAITALYADRKLMRGLIAAGLAQAKALSDAEGLVVMGYCFGGGVALEMARSDMAGEAAGYASFHGTLATPEGESWSGETPPLLIMHGAADQAVPMQDVTKLVDELEAAGVTYTVEIYAGAPHAFTVEGADSYQKRADQQSWAAFIAFLTRRLGG